MKQLRLGRPGPLVAVLLTAALLVLFAWWVRPASAAGDPVLLDSDLQVRVERPSWGLFFAPTGDRTGPGVVFYPGAKVPPEAYAYLGRAFAAAGHPTAIVRFPLNLAVFGQSKATAVFDSYPEIGSWVLGGHSLGGAMASAFCARQDPRIAGLLLLAAYPGGKADLSRLTLPVLSLSASNDGLATPAKVQAARHLLPKDTRYVVISGGSHAQFGEYGLQSGDGTPTVDGPTQRRAVIEESLGFLAGLSSAKR